MVVAIFLGFGAILFIVYWLIQWRNLYREKNALNNSFWKKNKNDGKRGVWITSINAGNASATGNITHSLLDLSVTTSKDFSIDRTLSSASGGTPQMIANNNSGFPTLNVLPSSKQLRMLQEQSTSPMRTYISGRNTANVTSLNREGYSSHDSSLLHTSGGQINQDGPNTGQSPQLPPIVDECPQSLEAMISREIEQIQQTYGSNYLTSNFANNHERSEKSRSLGGLGGPGPLNITNQSDYNASLSNGTQFTTTASSSTARVSRQDMELLADMVAARLKRDHDNNPTASGTGDAPPPSYS